MRRRSFAAAAIVAAAALFSACKPDPKVATLDEILLSRNDNDPRLDRDFLGLSSETKRAFRARYRALPPERRNERGVIVYLLGKNLTAPEDWAFLREVAGEPPCLSLSDCSKSSAGGGEPGDDVTLAYPSLVALRQAHRALEEGGPRDEAVRVLEAAKASKMRAVTRLAASLAPGFDKKSP